MKKLFLILIIFLAINAVFASSYNIQRANNYNLTISQEKTLFILDFSNSMNEYLGINKKVETMIETMQRILPAINPQKEVGMRAYGYRIGITAFDSCKASKLMVPISKGGANVIKNSIQKTRAIGMTPITYSLKKALYEDFSGFFGSKHIILLTDGGENCDESPCTFIMKEIRNQPNLKIDVIAYDIKDSDDLSQLECVATVTRGEFYTAETAAELANSINNSLDIETEVEGKIILP